MAADRKRRGGLGRVDPAVEAWQQGAAENPATVSAKRKRDRARTRLHIDVDEKLKAALVALTGLEREDTSLSQAAELLLAYGLREYARAVPELRRAFREGREPARTPRFGWNVEIPETWLYEIERFTVNGKVDGKIDGKN